MSERIRKLNDLIRDQVGQILHDKLRLQDGILLTVMGVVVSPTLEHATVRISVFPKAEAKKVLTVVNHHVYSVQQTLNHRLVMRPVPKIRFEIDITEERASQIEEILQKVNK